MLPQNKPDRIRILFDDHRLVANAGLLLPATLARHLGLRELVDHHLDLGGAPGRANTGDKMLTLVASALAGGDCIDDADALRAGGTVGVLGCVVKAPSTLGTFLRSFRWGHVRQLDRVSRQLLARAWAAGAGPGDSPLTIDLDSTICETYGLAKEGARHHGYTGARGYHPLLAIAAGTGEVLMSRLREGRANTARGAAHFLRETVGRVRYGGARGQLTVRADSGFYAHTVVAACREMDVRFSITIRQRASLRDLIEAIPEEDWTPIPYWMDGAADVAETTYTPFQTKPDAAPVRLIVRRVKPTPGSQLALFARYSYHAFITDRDGETLELEADHRRHAEVDRRVRLDFRGATITSDAGLLACRELDAALGLTETANDYIHESRTGRNVQHRLLPLLRQSVYSRLAGYEDTNDAERLAQDPAMRVIVGWQGTDKQAASTNTMSRFETEVLTEEENLDGLARLNVEWVDRAMAQTSHQRVILDMDSSESPVHGQQEGVAYNGHFESVCYHPLFLFNHFGDCEGAMLRPGNVHSAERWREVLEPVVKRYQEKGVRLLFRADAAFAKPEVYEYLESRDTGYAMRLPANEVLQGNIRHLLKRPVGRPPKKPVVRYHDFVYQAQSWDIPRRVVAKVEWHQGELFPRVGFVVTNLNLPPAGVTHYYNGRGTAEQWIKEGKYALNWTRLSCHRFVANQVRLWLFVLAYNLGNFMRRLTLPESVKHWSLRSVQTKLIKMGGRLVRHARRLVFQLAEVAVSREVFRQVLERIAGLHPAPG